MVQNFLRIVCRDIGSLKSLHTLFDKYFDHMLVKLEHSALAMVAGKSLMANLLQELIFLYIIGYIYVTIADADIGSRKFLHYTDGATTVLVKF